MNAYDLVIVGGGPAGLTAALYAHRNGRSVLVIEKETFGGQITHSPRVENWPGTAQMSGNEFAERLLDQVLSQGAEIEIDRVVSVSRENDRFLVQTESGSVFSAFSLILATGVRHRSLGLPGEDEMIGEGISYCAVCDGDFYAGKSTAVAGGGNSALQEALLLSEKCTSVTVLQDLPHCTGEKRLLELLEKKENVRILTDVRITALLRDASGAFRGVGIRQSDQDRELLCDGLFVAIGLIPENDAFSVLAKLDRYGYFDSDETCVTQTPGLFVAGDCRRKSVRQITTAAADGSAAALAACRYLDQLPRD